MNEDREPTQMPAGLHIESGWANEERKKEQDFNDWIKGQLGFGS